MAGMDTVSRELLGAQKKAEALFAAVVEEGLIRPGALESELSDKIHALARERFGLKRHWHRRIVRSGPNTLTGYYDDPPDRRMTDDDIVYLDFGPLFEEWEADYGRTYVIGSDPHKRKLAGDLADAHRRGKEFYRRTPDLTAGGLYDFISACAADYGWEFGAPTAGHLVGHFPHETAPQNSTRFSVRHGNPQLLREPDAEGKSRHWILEVHFVDRERQIGGFLEELLTVDEA
ncbi:MAG: aminopeptidase P family protein [Proteobacteria bacterium]|nr:aminopeptidase P family protein [Pseudomonadota bacterium]